MQAAPVWAPVPQPVGAVPAVPAAPEPARPQLLTTAAARVLAAPAATATNATVVAAASQVCLRTFEPLSFQLASVLKRPVKEYQKRKMIAKL